MSMVCMILRPVNLPNVHKHTVACRTSIHRHRARAHTGKGIDIPQTHRQRDRKIGRREEREGGREKGSIFWIQKCQILRRTSTAPDMQKQSSPNRQASSQLTKITRQATPSIYAEVDFL